jgi:hypothetical protein
MRLLQFDVSNSDPFQVELKIAYGDNDLLTTYDDNGNPLSGAGISDNEARGTSCKFGIAGGNFCAAAGLETTVTSRVE